MTNLTAAELEALAAQCRDPSFRAGLDSSPLWSVVASTLHACLDALDASFKRSAGENASTNATPATRVAGTTSEQDEDDEDDGLSYSFNVHKGASMDDISADSVTIHVDDEAATTLLVEQATSAFRFLRNACAASPSNQDACREHKLIHVAHDLVMRCCLWSDVEETDLAQAVVLLAQVALQFSVNAVTGRVANQELVWSLYFPDDFQKVMIECQEHRKIVAFTAALMLNCINKTLDDECVSKRRVELVESRNLIITLLQRCLTRPTSGASSSSSRPTIDDQDPAFEWLCLVFKVLFQAGYSKHLYNAVGAHLLSKLWSRVTPEQLILLRMFTMWMTAHREASSNDTAAVERPRTTPGQASCGPLQDETAYHDVFEFVTKTWAYLVSSETEDRPEEADETRKLLWIEFENEAKLLLLDVAGELTLARVASTPSMRDNMELLLQSLLQELDRVWKLRRLGAPAPPRPGAGSTASPQRDAAATLPATEPFGYRSAIIRNVGNLTYRHVDHQDVVRDGGFLPLFLNHCNIDEANPLLREWSLVALRNLCEGNEANQAFIHALRPQGIDRASVDLDKLNVDAALGDDGKVRVTRKPAVDGDGN